MEYKIDLKLKLPDELVSAVGINEDTPFETHFENGSIRVRMLDEDDIAYLKGEEDEGQHDPDDIPEKCVGCQNYCLHCGGCTIGNL